jgi:hypothetical protein
LAIGQTHPRTVFFTSFYDEVILLITFNDYFIILCFIVYAELQIKSVLALRLGGEMSWECIFHLERKKLAGRK